MKKALLVLILIVYSSNTAYSQEWLTSLEVAKQLALIQDKMIIALWEDAVYNGFQVITQNDENFIVSDLVTEESYNKIIWKYFVPVIIPENKYEDLWLDIKEKRNSNYLQKFNDNSIKIMDSNGNILNTNSYLYQLNNSSFNNLLETYALKTTYLKQELKNYALNRNFTTSFRLASKYLDYAIFASKSLRTEISELSDIYMQEAIEYLESENLSNRIIYQQRIELLKIKKYVIIDSPKKALRMLKKFDDSEIDSSNRSLYAFLHFASYRLLNNIELSMKWQNEVPLIDLKKMKYLLD